MEKTLTVIVPTYNMEKYLDRCLSSLVVPAEQMDLLEVLVINDGSKDRSSEIAHDYESRYPGIFRVIDKSNGHYGSCVNRGLSEAVGKYVKVLDADDWFETSNFVSFISFLAENDCDLIISTTGALYNSDTPVLWNSSMEPYTKYSIYDLPLYFNGDLAHQMITYRHEVLQKLKYSQTEGISYTDLEWAYKPMAAVSTIMYFPKTVYIYVLSREGQSVSPENYCRDIWMEQGIILKLIRTYEEQKNNYPKDNRRVLQMILLLYVKRVYYHYLFDYPKMLGNDGLLAFDNEFFGESSELYRCAADALIQRKAMNLRYIQEWRRKKSRKTLKFYYMDFCSAIGKSVRYLHGKFR